MTKIALNNMPLGPIKLQSLTCRLLNFNQAGVIEPSLFQSQSLSPSTSANFDGIECHLIRQLKFKILYKYTVIQN